MKNFIKISANVFFAVAIMFGLTGLTTNPSVAHAAQPTVDLGTAASFAILSGTPNITDAGNASTITGNVGLSPATGAGIGLTAAQVTGTIYAVNAAGPAGSVNDPALLTTAKNDLTTAFNDAANRGPAITVPTELGGQTLTAGVYNSASTTFGITAGSGALVLNGQGDSNAVFIFEMNSGATGLVVGPGSTVTLTNGASACNVFWRVNTATINTTAVFKGNILALTSITVANGADIEGRLLARNGNVTLINDTITAGLCVAQAAAEEEAAAAEVAAAEAATAAAAAAAAAAEAAAIDTATTELPSTGAFNMLSFVVIPSIVVVILATYLIRRNKQFNLKIKKS